MWIAFLSLNQVKITSFSNCFKQLSLSWRFASVSFLAGISKLFNPRLQWKNDPVRHQTAILMCWTMNLWLIILVQYQVIYCCHIFSACVLHLPLLCLRLVQFLKTNISLDSVTTQLRWGGIFHECFIANILLNVTVTELSKSVNIWHSYRQEFDVLFFWVTVYVNLRLLCFVGASSSKGQKSRSLTKYPTACLLL